MQQQHCRYTQTSTATLLHSLFLPHSSTAAILSSHFSLLCSFREGQLSLTCVSQICSERPSGPTSPEQLQRSNYLSDIMLTDPQCIFWVLCWMFTFICSDLDSPTPDPITTSFLWCSYLFTWPYHSSQSNLQFHPIPQRPHSTSCHVIKNPPTHHLESILSFLFPFLLPYWGLHHPLLRTTLTAS